MHFPSGLDPFPFAARRSIKRPSLNRGDKRHEKISPRDSVEDLLFTPVIGRAVGVLERTARKTPELAHATTHVSSAMQVINTNRRIRDSVGSASNPSIGPPSRRELSDGRRGHAQGAHDPDHPKDIGCPLRCDSPHLFASSLEVHTRQHRHRGEVHIDA